MTKSCIYCGTQFKARNGFQKICLSAECKRKQNAENNRRRRERHRKKNPVTTHRPCIECGDLIDVRGRWNLKYCDKPECQAIRDNARKEALKHYPKFSNSKTKPKVKRQCQGQLAGCLGTIDNANRYYCSYCHRRLTQFALDVPGAYGGLVGQEVF